MYIYRDWSILLYFTLMLTTKMNKKLKWALVTLFVLLLAAGAIVWYVFNEKFADTTQKKADYTVNAMGFIKEFQQDRNAANKKYTEKIIVVNGIVAQVETADTTANIKFIDSLTGAYVIFAFQQQHLNEAKTIKTGDQVSIKGSCSGGAYSSILETDYITFKRCAINK